MLESTCWITMNLSDPHARSLGASADHIKPRLSKLFISVSVWSSVPDNQKCVKTVEIDLNI